MDFYSFQLLSNYHNLLGFLLKKDSLYVYTNLAFYISNIQLLKVSRLSLDVQNDKSKIDTKSFQTSCTNLVHYSNSRINQQVS